MAIALVVGNTENIHFKCRRKAEPWWTLFFYNEQHALIDDTFLRVITELAGGSRMDKVIKLRLGCNWCQPWQKPVNLTKRCNDESALLSK
jgi:hypothetical protein